MIDGHETPGWLIATVNACATLSLLIWGVITVRIARGQDPVRWRPRRHVPWGAGGAVLAALYLYLAALQSVQEILVSITDSPAPAPAPPEPEGALISLEMVLKHSAGAFLLSLVTAFAIHRTSGAGWREFGLPGSTRQLLSDVGIGLLTFLAALLPVYAIQFVVVVVFDLPSSHPTLERLMSDPSGQSLLAAGLMAVVVAPLIEEFAFRVLLQGWFERLAGSARRRSAKWWPILASSFLFAITHQGQGAAPIALFVFAILLGYLYRQTHRMAPSVAAHMAFNAFSLLMAWGSVAG